jgi:hypothetical protein
MERKRKAQFKTYTEITEKRAMIYVSIKIATAVARVGSGLVGLVLSMGMTQILTPHIPSYSAKY